MNTTWKELNDICQRHSKLKHLMNLGGHDLRNEINRLTGSLIPDMHPKAFPEHAIKAMQKAGYA